MYLQKIPLRTNFIFILIPIMSGLLFSCSNKKIIEFEVSSQQIYKEYQENEVAADLKYRDKYIKVTGYLISFDKTLGRSYCYIGSPDDLIGEVRCLMSEEFIKQSGSFQKGQSMWVEGICKGADIIGVVNIE